MLQQNTPSRFVKGIEYVNLSTLLTDFRKRIEKDLDSDLSGVDLNAAMLLADLCRFLGFNAELTERVIGNKASCWLASVEGDPIKVKQN